MIIFVSLDVRELEIRFDYIPFRNIYYHFTEGGLDDTRPEFHRFTIYLCALNKRMGRRYNERIKLPRRTYIRIYRLKIRRLPKVTRGNDLNYPKIRRNSWKRFERLDYALIILLGPRHSFESIDCRSNRGENRRKNRYRKR